MDLADVGLELGGEGHVAGGMRSEDREVERRLMAVKDGAADCGQLNRPDHVGVPGGNHRVLVRPAGPPCPAPVRQADRDRRRGWDMLTRR